MNTNLVLGSIIVVLLGSLIGNAKVPIDVKVGLGVIVIIGALLASMKGWV